MRTRKEIWDKVQPIAVPRTEHAILEVLLDIRELLIKLVES